jgi:prepilin-type N-terminal cleavage/methylation domain-containing protein
MKPQPLPPHGRRPDGNQAGFTLLEMMMATAIAAFTLAGIMSTYIYSVRAFQAAYNYQIIHQAGRNAIDMFAKDVRAASTVNAASAANLNISIPTAISSQGTVTAAKTVNWLYSNGALYRYDSDTGFTDMLASNIYDCSFTLFDKVLNSNAVISVAKSAQLDIKLRMYVTGKSQSEDYLSARFDMRNKP